MEGTPAEVLEAAGIDIEFLLALPDDMRNEVVLQQVPEIQLFSAPQQCHVQNEQPIPRKTQAFSRH